MSDIFKALASEPRRRILDHLADGPMSVSAVAERFDMAMPSISKHLSVLREAGLVTEKRFAQHVFYRLDVLNLTDPIYAFIARFCPEAREIARRRAGGDERPGDSGGGKIPKKGSGKKKGRGKKGGKQKRDSDA